MHSGISECERPILPLAVSRDHAPRFAELAIWLCGVHVLPLYLVGDCARFWHSNIAGFAWDAFRALANRANSEPRTKFVVLPTLVRSILYTTRASSKNSAGVGCSSSQTIDIGRLPS